MKLVERVKALWNLFTKGTMTKAEKVILLLAVIYCLSPIDIIPDVAPMVGFLDDLVIILATLRHLSNKPEERQQDEQPVQVDAKVL